MKALIEGVFRPGLMTYEEYDPNYPVVVAQVAEAIHEVLPEAHVEHVGSTAVPGLGGRRNLDIVVPADPTRHEDIVAKLLGIGFIESPLTHFKPMLAGTTSFKGKNYP